jgi:membrane fusion protein (multidrug efflux system)
LQLSRGTCHRLRQTARTAGVVTPIQLEQARIQVITDSLNIVAIRGHYHAAEQLTNYLHLKALLAGIITERNLSPGADVGTSRASVLPLFKLQQLSCLRLRVAVLEAYTAETRQISLVGFTVKSIQVAYLRAVSAASKVAYKRPSALSKLKSTFLTQKKY